MYELSVPMATLLEEIGDPEMSREDVAKTYALALRTTSPVDWSCVNHAIVERWSKTALR